MTRAQYPVAKVSEIAAGQIRIVSVGTTRIALCNVAGTLYAVEDRCTHDDGPLGEGTLQGETIECPRHGALFDVKNGAAVRMPAVVPIRTFPVRLEGEQVFVEVEAP
jgi:3-phenylpropionate/trans-cinnamate dioxygenase ferredoxin subunit